MSVVLAASWVPRGELPRLERLYPFLSEVYQAFAISLSGHVEPSFLTALGELPEVAFIESGFESGRHFVVELALKQGGTHIHYVDMDRLIRWAETRPDELCEIVERIPTTDCLILGRTKTAYATHPDALRLTEVLTNAAISHWFGRSMDILAGARGMSRGAAAYVLARSPRDSALRMEAEWAVLWRRAGFGLDYAEVDGLDWESADQYQEQAADAQRQKDLAAAYDRDAENWRVRARVAHDVLLTGLAATERDLDEVLTLW